MYLLILLCVLGYLSPNIYGQTNYSSYRNKRDYSPWNNYGKPNYHHHYDYSKTKWSVPYNPVCGSLIPSFPIPSPYPSYVPPTSYGLPIPSPSGPPSSYYPYNPPPYEGGLPPPKLPPTFYDSPPNNNDTSTIPPTATIPDLNITSTIPGDYGYQTYGPTEIPPTDYPSGYYYPKPSNHYGSSPTFGPPNHYGSLPTYGAPNYYGPSPTYGPSIQPPTNYDLHPSNYYRKYSNYYWPFHFHRPDNNQQQVVYIQQPNILPILPIPPPTPTGGGGFLPTGNSNKMSMKNITAQPLSQDDNQIDVVTEKSVNNFDKEIINSDLKIPNGNNVENTFQTQQISKSDNQDVKHFPIFNGTASKQS